MAQPAPPTKKPYKQFYNEKPWVDPSFIRLGPPAPIQPGVNSSALFGLEYTRDIDKRPINQSTENGLKNYNNYSSTKPDNLADGKGQSGMLYADDLNLSKQGNKSKRESYVEIERGVHNLQQKVDAVDRKIESLDEGYREVPSRIGEVETDMASKGYQVEELEWRNKVHSAKIHELERELRNVKMENDVIKGRLIGPDGPLPNIPEDSYRGGGMSDRNGYYGEPSKGYDQDPYQNQGGGGGGSPRQPPPEGQGRQRRVYENEQHNIAHRHGGPDGEPYWGFNRYYNPQFVTAYRREHVPYYARLEEKEQEEEWRRKREEEEKLMKDKPRTFDYTVPYQSQHPPRDINKYFHDSRYLTDRPEQKPDEEYFKSEHDDRPLGTGHTTYEDVYVPPIYGTMAQQQPGGLYIIRFHDSGFDEVNVSLKEQQTIIKSFNGFIIGIARKHNVIAIEGDADWRYSRTQAPRPQISVRHKNVEDAMGVIWFPSREKAFDFFSNSFRNRFKQQGFPTPHAWEGHFVPLLSPPFQRNLDTYLVIEMLNVGMNNPQRQQNIQQFEAEARQEVQRLVPSSMPFVVSAMKGRDAFKPGPLFRDRSKVFVSLFSSMAEMSEVWSRGIIQSLLQKYNLTAPLNVTAFALKDWMDY